MGDLRVTNTKLTNQAQIEDYFLLGRDEEGITLGDLAKISGFMQPAVITILQKLKRSIDEPTSAFIFA